MRKTISSEDADVVCNVSNGLLNVSAILDCLSFTLDTECADAIDMNGRIDASHRVVNALIELVNGYQQELSRIYNEVLMPHVLLNR